MPTPRRVQRVVYLLAIGLFGGTLTSCAPILVGPTEPNSSLVLGRIVINNKNRGHFSGALPLGTIEERIEVEVESLDRNQRFLITTGEQGFFFIPNVPPNTYQVVSVAIEGRVAATIERYRMAVRRLNFTPVPGRIAYIGTLIVDVPEDRRLVVRETREDDRGRAYFLERYATSAWAGREFVAAGPRPIPTLQVAQEKAPQAIETKPITRLGFKAEKPEWKVGYEWRYAWKQPGTSGILTREIIREDTFEGVLCYVIRIGKNQNFYPKDTLGLLATMSGGKLTFKRNAPLQRVSWPLEVGKEWKNSFTLESLEEKSSRTYDFRFVVSKIEEVTVPAGTFEAFKIENYGVYTGNLVAEYWYSPKVKWFIKERLYPEKGVLERELISFKVD
jgi:hypothetical protein